MGAAEEVKKSAASVSGVGPDSAMGQQGHWSGREAGYEIGKTARTNWNAPLPLTASNLNDVGNLQKKLLPFIMELPTHWLRTQRNRWRKSSGSLRCCSLHCCPTIMK